MEETLWMFSTV